jgi:hypothetical protein
MLDDVFWLQAVKNGDATLEIKEDGKLPDPRPVNVPAFE